MEYKQVEKTNRITVSGKAFSDKLIIGYVFGAINNCIATMSLVL